jgi:hypothetical protein
MWPHREIRMKMITSKRCIVLAMVILSYAAVAQSAYAMGVANGRTKIDFTTKTTDFLSSRLFAKIDVSAGITSNANFISGSTATVGKHGNGHGSSKNGGLNNFVLANCDVTLAIGSATFSGHAESKGKVLQPFNAKLTANGRILQIKASGLNLVELFPLNTADGKYSVVVPITVTATRTTINSDSSTSSLTVTLSEQSVTFNYTVKHERARGRNF